MHNGSTESHHELSPHDEPVVESGIARPRGATFLYMCPCGQCPRRGTSLMFGTSVVVPYRVQRCALWDWEKPLLLRFSPPGQFSVRAVIVRCS